MYALFHSFSSSPSSYMLLFPPHRHRVYNNVKKNFIANMNINCVFIRKSRATRKKRNNKCQRKGVVDGWGRSVNEMRNFFILPLSLTPHLCNAHIKAREVWESDLRKLDNSRNYAHVAYAWYENSLHCMYVVECVEI